MANVNRTNIKAGYDTSLANNTSGDITPAVHRSVLDDFKDSCAFQKNANTFEGIQTMSERVRFNTTEFSAANSSASAETLGAVQRILVIDTTEDINFPSSPAVGDWYEIKNISSTDVSLNGNGNQFYTSSAKGTLTLYQGQKIMLYWSGTYWV